ncbi:transglycosylase SLT domain-containing protein [Thiomicrospira microaerophila]|uniref:transglycosylase SLT domain-containing protein n=1 Tax=Thiomicrospira microaerophila TaxID=406020 RepID=UPI0005C91C0E|nr:lipoprotein [Thiomicrospira microaerophila]
MPSQLKTHFRFSFISFFSLMVVLGLLSGCSTTPPPASSHNNICQIIEHDPRWYKAAKKSEEKWGTSVAIQKAFVHQESRFVHNARPPRDYALGFIPLPRKSSAFGYAQAQNPAWYDYQKATGNYRARRDNIYDALDFIGWYNSVSNQRNGISLRDPYNLYLAYHEGHGGYRRKTYNQKPWLIEVAKKVDRQSKLYDQQLRSCNNLPRRFCIWPFC